MTPFAYEKAGDVPAALRLTAGSGQSRYLGGGTNLVDLMRETVEQPGRLVDVSGLSTDIEDREDGSILIGAGAKNTAVATNILVRRRFPVLSRALLAGASAQIRNMATVGGNVMQRTRCTYFYDGAARCNKREPGQGCDAVGGFNRIHAILGASSSCVATHPSDMCVALAALDATVHLHNRDRGASTIPLLDLHRLPGDRPDIDTVLQPGDLITGVELPALPFAARSTYRKVRDRSSYAFALISVAAALDLGPDGRIKDVRLALGGVAHKPWRALKAEAALQGKPATAEHFREAAEAELAEARPLEHNGFKIELVKRVVTSVLGKLAGETA